MVTLMANGTHKRIKDVKVGDKVLATDPTTGHTGPHLVVTLFRHTGLRTMVDLKLANGSKLTATDHHPIWEATTRTFTDAINLTPGHKLLAANGRAQAVTATTNYRQGLTAYNLQIADVHTYYVLAGATAILVHNSGGPVPCAMGQAGETASGITKNTQTLIINGRSRTPDQLTATTIGEVKNVQYQYLSSQLRDYLAYAQQNALQFNLYVRGGGGTRLSGPLQKLVDSGDINLIENLP